MEDDQADDSEPGRWLIIVRFQTSVLFGFVSEVAARAAYLALSKAVTNEADGAELILQERDENGNWLTIEETHLQ